MAAVTLPLLPDASIRTRVRQTIAVVAALLGHPLAPGDVHALRRAIKQLRAWCCLLEAAGKPGAKRLRRSLRELAAHYGAARDAQVQLDTLLALEAAGDVSFPQSRHMLEAAVLPLTAPPSATLCAHYRDTLRLLGGLLDQQLPGAKALQRGLARSHRKAARRCKEAWHTLQSEALHDLRKTVKILANQYALCVDRRGAAGRFQRHLVKLGNRLGAWHDIVVLREALTTAADNAALRRELEQIDTMTQAQEQELLPLCMALSEECFPGKVR